MLIGLGQFNYDTSSGLNTSGVPVSTPTGSQTDASLNAIAQAQCMDTPGSIWDPSSNSCQGSGSGSAAGGAGCPSGYVLSGFSCVAAAPTGSSTPAACPAGSTCSIVPGISNTNIYLAVAAVASMFFVAMAFGGHR